MSKQETQALVRRIEALCDDEQEIVRSLVHRINRGRETYGPWKVTTDARNYRREALFEVYDALHYCAAELVRLSRIEEES